MVDIRLDDFFLLSPCSVTCGYKYMLFKRSNTACVRANVFAERVINHWNSLPDSVNFSSFIVLNVLLKVLNLLALEINYFSTVRLHVRQRMVLLSQFCLSVCPSHACTVTKLNDGRRIF